ncbi:unnamed protein product [Arabis nemorensis]|uniref:DUF295 domain-containing protein n=1 Tax=Arabis nemorensis TaxID=586526 RepID=A0A565BVN9_9BRAS|nr:unnamed protein product [Arabis nemorensis]
MVNNNIPPVYERYQLPQIVGISAVAYNSFLANTENHNFALAGSARVYGFSVHPKSFEVDCDPNKFYSDEAANESFRVLCWGWVYHKRVRNGKTKVRNDFYILAGGVGHVIRVINSHNFTLHKTLDGHRDTVTDIRSYHNSDSLICSASTKFNPIPTPTQFCCVDFDWHDHYAILSCGQERGVRRFTLSKEAWRPRWLTYSSTRTKDMAVYGQVQTLDVNSNVKFFQCLDKAILTNCDNEDLVLFNYLRQGANENQRTRIATFPPTTSRFEPNFHDVVALGNDQGEITIQDFGFRRNVLFQFQDPPGLPIIATAISNNNSLVITINNQGQATIWGRRG